MTTTFLIADLHFGHRKLAEGDFGSRPWKSVEEHDEALISGWNRTVGDDDTVYVLGDVAMGQAGLRQVCRLKGHKRLVLGNHDNERTPRYVTGSGSPMRGFDRVYAMKAIDGMLLTHIPIHPACLNRRSMKANVHGHLHEESVMLEIAGRRSPFKDHRYRCVSAEQVDYRPISLDVVREGFGELLA